MGVSTPLTRSISVSAGMASIAARKHATGLAAILIHAVLRLKATPPAVQSLQALQRAWDWLAEQPEDASELAAVLNEAVPRLKLISNLTSRPSRAQTSREALELLHADMTLLERLQAARPMLVGTSAVKCTWH